MPEVPDLVLALPFQGHEHLLDSIETDLEAIDFDPRRNAIGATRAMQAPEVAVAIRLSLLLRIYRGDYRTDAFDLPRLAARVRLGEEGVWFWGSGSEIARLEAALRGGTPPDDLELGTVSVISAAAELGSGRAELCRSGSCDRSLGAKAPIMARTLAFLRGQEPWLTPRFRSLVLVPRNRASTDEVRGGEPIQRIHARYVRSALWGFAPWYVMQGGVLECLDLRESHSEPGAVLRALENGERWFFADAIDAEFAAALCALNFGAQPRIDIVRSRPGQGREAAHVEVSQKLAQDNRCIVGVDRDATDILHVCVARCVAARACCVVVKVPLDDRASVRIQAWVSEQGFVLTAVLPGDGQRRPYGFWSRPRPDLPIAPPYYAGFATSTENDAAILRHLRRLLRGWER